MSMETLSVSSMNCWLTCQRKHLYAYQYGIRAAQTSDALRFGTAWHAGQEFRAKNYKAGMDDAERAALAQGMFEAALSTASDWDEFVVATLQGAIAAFVEIFKDDLIANMDPEIEFTYSIDGSRTFKAGGKIDGIATLVDGRKALVEHKTTSEPIEDADAPYWARLRLNFQLCRYVKGARAMGQDIETVIYDVFHKPALKPSDSIKDLDENGLPIIVDANGARCIKRDGTPKKTADAAKGERALSHAETPEEFADRIRTDILARPGFYFQRREVTVTEEQIAAFSLTETQMAKQIVGTRQDGRDAVARGVPYCAAFMQNVGQMTCQHCDYEAICMAGKTLSPDVVPDGFKQTGATPELSNK